MIAGLARKMADLVNRTIGSLAQTKDPNPLEPPKR